MLGDVLLSPGRARALRYKRAEIAFGTIFPLHLPRYVN